MIAVRAITGRGIRSDAVTADDHPALPANQVLAPLRPETHASTRGRVNEVEPRLDPRYIASRALSGSADMIKSIH
jgi:hypothetical protein